MLTLSLGVDGCMWYCMWKKQHELKPGINYRNHSWHAAQLAR
jgi:hypothetical protein